LASGSFGDEEHEPLASIYPVAALSLPRILSREAGSDFLGLRLSGPPGGRLGNRLLESHKPDAAKVDIQSEAASTEAQELLHALEHESVQVELKSPEECRRRLEIGQTAMYIVPGAGNYEYVYDETRTEGREARFQADAIIQRWKARDKYWRLPMC